MKQGIRNSLLIIEEILGVKTKAATNFHDYSFEGDNLCIFVD
ncbi:MAG: hypothetical protein PHV76_04170 [Bacteroidales bacterium]|jgi:hypothetical protein|nr:hypothetical protein [Bacteroidales bacterium]